MVNTVQNPFLTTGPTATQPFGYSFNYNAVQPTQNQQPIMSNKIVVDSIEDVQNYYVPFGGSIIFLHKSQPIMYCKTVDNKGTCIIKTYDITEHIQEDPYVSKKDFAVLQEQILELKKLITNDNINNLADNSKINESARS